MRIEQNKTAIAENVFRVFLKTSVMALATSCHTGRQYYFLAFFVSPCSGHSGAQTFPGDHLQTANWTVCVNMNCAKLHLNIPDRLTAV